MRGCAQHDPLCRRGCELLDLKHDTQSDRLGREAREGFDGHGAQRSM
jgi:hypothetical protein